MVACRPGISDHPLVSLAPHRVRRTGSLLVCDDLSLVDSSTWRGRPPPLSSLELSQQHYDLFFSAADKYCEVHLRAWCLDLSSVSIVEALGCFLAME